MTNEEFESPVKRLEDYSLRSPGMYKFKVVLLTALGNIYVYAMVIIIIATIVGMTIAMINYHQFGAVKFIILTSFFLGMVLKAMKVELVPPAGIEIDDKQAPALFSLIEELRTTIQAPRFHHVLISDEMNAGVTQKPRLGIFGWQINYLTLGLLLMKTLSVEQFKAVLAHEFGHLSRGHGRISNWIYCQRIRWSNVYSVLEKNSSLGNILFIPFLKWFIPYLNAYSFPLARANEYEADATSVKLTSKHVAAEALTNINVITSYLREQYWPQIYKLADDQPQPDFLPYTRVCHYVTSQMDKEKTASWLDQSITSKTGIDDTHPSLSDRLRAIGETPRLAIPEIGKTADSLLGNALQTITDKFDNAWIDSVKPSWEKHNKEIQDKRAKLADLNTRFSEGKELTIQELFDRATLTDSIGNNPDAALSQFRELHRQNPDDSAIILSLGELLLHLNNSEGISFIQHAMQVDEFATINACTILRDYYWRTGSEKEAHDWHKRLVERQQLEDAANKERDAIYGSDEYEPHDLPSEYITDLCNHLKECKELTKAYLVKKKVKYFIDKPCYVLAYKTTRFNQIYNEERSKRVEKAIIDCFITSAGGLIFNIEKNNKYFGRKILKVKNSRII